MYCEQADSILEREITNAYLSGVTELVVIHGKGTGALRESVLKTLYAHKDKWFEIIKGENTKEIGDSGFIKVKIKHKEIVINKYSAKKKKPKEETKEDYSYLENVKEKKENGKQKYLKMMKRLKEVNR
jgi:dsDNA-specific endonuclease/ATPase MutS2